MKRAAGLIFDEISTPVSAMTKERVQQYIKELDTLNGTDEYRKIDWDNPSTELPDFLKKN